MFRSVNSMHLSIGTFHQHSPLTCCSRVIITSTAIFSMPSLVCGLSDFRCDMHMRPSSFNASLISRIRILKAVNELMLVSATAWPDGLYRLFLPFSCVVRLSSLSLLPVLGDRIQIIVIIVVIGARTTTRGFTTNSIVDIKITIATHTHAQNRTTT